MTHQERIHLQSRYIKFCNIRDMIFRVQALPTIACDNLVIPAFASTG